MAKNNQTAKNIQTPKNIQTATSSQSSKEDQGSAVEPQSSCPDELALLEGSSPSVANLAAPQEWVEAVLVVTSDAVLANPDSGRPAVLVSRVCDEAGDLVASPAVAVARVSALFPRPDPASALGDGAELIWDAFVDVGPRQAFLGTFRHSPLTADADPEPAAVAVSVSVIYLRATPGSSPVPATAWVPKGEADLSGFVPAGMCEPGSESVVAVPEHIAARLGELDHTSLLSRALSSRTPARVLVRVPAADADASAAEDAADVVDAAAAAEGGQEAA